jgi:hypothetical protein
VNVNQGKIAAGHGGAHVALSSYEIRQIVEQALKAWGGPPKKLLILPPDMTRLHSGAGEITCMIYELCKGKSQIDILPAIGTHAQMTEAELKHMFPGIPLELFRQHDWRGGVKRMGQIPGAFVHEQSEGKLDWPIDVLTDNLLADGGHDLVLSIGQVVPHEVVGLANQNKNILIGVGGTDFLNKSHFLGAVYGMERMMGRADTPVRRVFDYDKTHPYRQKDILAALRQRVPGRPLNQFDMQAVRYVHGIDARPEFSHKSLYGGRQYSERILHWLVEQATKNEHFFDDARQQFTQHRTRR